MPFENPFRSIRNADDQLRWIRILVEAEHPAVRDSGDGYIKIGPVEINVPIGEVNVNRLGLIAQDKNSCVYLCRQKWDHSHRTSAREDEYFIQRNPDLEYRSFFVNKKRIYHAVVCLSEGPERLKRDIDRLLSGVQEIPE